MSYRTAGQPATFTFPAIFEGREVTITVTVNNGQYRVLINNNPVARLALDENGYNWLVAAGELADSDLIKEIGNRIKAKSY